jgi:hypothetical protein
LYTLLTTPFPGIEATDIKICGPILDDVDVNMDGLDLK